MRDGHKRWSFAGLVCDGHLLLYLVKTDVKILQLARILEDQMSTNETVPSEI